MARAAATAGTQKVCFIHLALFVTDGALQRGSWTVFSEAKEKSQRATSRPFVTAVRSMLLVTAHLRVHATHTHTHTHARTHAARTRTHARTHTHTRTHARTHTHTHARTRTHAHARTLTHARTHAHTHTPQTTTNLLTTDLTLHAVLKAGQHWKEVST